MKDTFSEKIKTVLELLFCCRSKIQNYIFFTGLSRTPNNTFCVTKPYNKSCNIFNYTRFVLFTFSQSVTLT